MKLVQLAVVTAVLVAATAALAADPPKAAASSWPPPLPTPGAEEHALDSLVGTMTMEGTITPPPFTGAKPSKTTITATCKRVAADMFIACDTEGHPADPKFPKFKSHVLMGYDHFTKQYVAMSATMQGIVVVEHGAFDGKKLVFTSDPVQGPQHKTIARTTFDFTDPKKLHQVEDRSVDGGPFVVFGDMTQK